MAVLSTVNPTFIDLAKRLDPDGKIALIVELLNQTNEMLADMTWVEGNLLTGHRTTIRTGIPEPTWRKINQGVQPTKSTTAQVTHGTAMLEAYAEVDKALADLNGNTAEWRLSEERPHIEGMNQMVQQTLIYGNEASNPSQFTGLAPHYNTPSAESGDNMINAGASATPGTTDNNSIWLVVWGPNTVHGIVPKGSTAGLQITDKGQITIENVAGSGGRMEAYRTHYRWDVGLCVRDWRYVVRIANISKAALTPDANSGPNLPNLMFEAIERVQDLQSGRAAFYMSRHVRTKLRQQSSAGVRNSTLTIEQLGGVPTMAFHGIPIRLVEKLGADESAINFT